ncbi:MAG: hypothetical protein ABJB34_01540 [Acidobacteriota bacterium]
MNYIEVSSAGITPVFIQITGALYLGFAVMNWMAKTVFVGGIFARPLAIGYFSHFIIGALALLKYGFNSPSFWAVWAAAIITRYLQFFSASSFLHIRSSQATLPQTSLNFRSRR